MTTNPLATIDRRGRRDVDVLFGALADVLSNAFDRYTTPERPITALDRLRIMADVDRALEVIYGPVKGTDGALTQIVVRDAQTARFEPLDAAVKTWRSAMTQTLRERVESEAKRG